MRGKELKGVHRGGAVQGSAQEGALLRLWPRKRQLSQTWPPDTTAEPTAWRAALGSRDCRCSTRRGSATAARGSSPFIPGGSPWRLGRRPSSTGKGKSTWRTAAVTPPKSLPAKRPPSSLGPPPPLSPGQGAPTDSRFPKKAPPNVVKYKGPPHGGFVRGIRSRSPQGDRPHRSKPKPLSLVHPQHRAHNSYHSWERQQREEANPDEGAASGAPRIPPQVILREHKCLDRGWDYGRSCFKNRTALAL